MSSLLFIQDRVRTVKMRIYHYTTIDALALILKNKTLLFNRLDCVDDMEEGAVESEGVRLGQYTFVSCWTESAEESIPLWKMYAGNSMGVRIGLEKDMFKKFFYINPLWGGQQFYGSIFQPLPPSAFERKDCFVFPIFSLEGPSDFFYRRIQYVDNVFEKTKNAVRITPKGDGTAETHIALGEIGRYKHQRWAFQEETRFALHIFPFNPFFEDINNVGSVAINAYLQNKPLGFKKYYMHLNEEVLSNIEITLSPNATESQHIIVDALAAQYAKSATIRSSNLNQSIRF